MDLPTSKLQAVYRLFLVAILCSFSDVTDDRQWWRLGNPVVRSGTGYLRMRGVSKGCMNKPQDSALLLRSAMEDRWS